MWRGRCLFYLETNGILFGADGDYVKRPWRFDRFIYVRASSKRRTLFFGNDFTRKNYTPLVYSSRVVVSLGPVCD